MFAQINSYDAVFWIYNDLINTNPMKLFIFDYAHQDFQ